MKQTLITISLIFLLKSNLFSQNYLNQTARWYQTQTYSGSWNEQNTYVEQYSTLYFAGDTTINSQTYMKLFNAKTTDNTVSYYDSIGEFVSEFSTYSDTVFEGFIREESKVIYWNLGSTDLILYDFNIQSNDLVSSLVFYDGCDANSEILNFETVCIGSISRKKWNVTGNFYSLIEGVGSSKGFLTYVCTYNGCPECNYSSVDFELNGDFLYTGNCANVGLSENSIPKIINIFPNPTTNFINIEESSKFESFELIDIKGELILKNKLNSSKIDVSSLQNGIYFLNLFTDDKIIVRNKIIKE